jgi:hypothetical protein
MNYNPNKETVKMERLVLLVRRLVHTATVETRMTTVLSLQSLSKHKLLNVKLRLKLF